MESSNENSISTTGTTKHLNAKNGTTTKELQNDENEKGERFESRQPKNYKLKHISNRKLHNQRWNSPPHYNESKQAITYNAFMSMICQISQIS